MKNTSMGVSCTAVQPRGGGYRVTLSPCPDEQDAVRIAGDVAIECTDSNTSFRMGSRYRLRVASPMATGTGDVDADTARTPQTLAWCRDVSRVCDPEPGQRVIATVAVPDGTISCFVVGRRTSTGVRWYESRRGLGPDEPLPEGSQLVAWSLLAAD